jgi:hypothetical protein
VNRGPQRGAGAARLLAALLLCFGLLLMQAQARAQADTAGAEYRVKAAFLFKFTGYVDWPDAAFAAPDAPLVIGVLGAEALAAELARVVEGRRVNERSVQVRRVRPGELPTGLHLLFLARTEAPLGPVSVPALAPALQGRPVLVVTEADAAMPPLSAINFVVAERRVRFEIALDAAERAGLRLSSRLLAVAQKVHTGAP